jgi:hypothetical protein
VKRRPLLTLATGLLLAPAIAQLTPTIDWQRTYGGTNWDHPFSIAPTADAGYVVAGYTHSNNGDVTNYHGGYDYWVVKLDSTGGLQWQKALGGLLDDIGHLIITTNDGGYVVTGHTESFNGDVTGHHGGLDFWLVKLNSLGGIQWQKALGGSDDDYSHSIVLTNDGGYVVTGLSRSSDGDATNNHGNADCWVVKLDSTGNLQWQKSLGGSGSDEGLAVAIANDGGYYVAGSTNSNDGDVSNNHGAQDIWVIKLDSDGDIQWQKCLGGSDTERTNAIICTTSGGSIVAGFTESTDGDVSDPHGSFDYWIVALDSTGDLQWEKSFGGSDAEFPHFIVPATGGGYVVAGTTSSVDGDVTDNHGDDDMWLVQIDSIGDLIWQKTFGGSSLDQASFIARTQDDNYILTGGTYSTDGDITSNHGGRDYWVVKLGPGGVGIPETLLVDLTCSPNPAHDHLHVRTQQVGSKSTLSLTDPMGREVLYTSMSGTSHMLAIDDLPRGLYLVTLRTEQGNSTQRMVLE